MSFKYRASEDGQRPGKPDLTPEEIAALPRPPSAAEVWARQFSASPAQKTPEPSHVVWGRQFAKKAPVAPSVPPRSSIPQTFATSRTPVVSLGVKLSGIRGCAILPSAVDSIRTLIRSGRMESLIEAREQIEKLPSDHADGWRLVNELFDALGKFTNQASA